MRFCTEGRLWVLSLIVLRITSGSMWTWGMITVSKNSLNVTYEHVSRLETSNYNTLIISDGSAWFSDVLLMLCWITSWCNGPRKWRSCSQSVERLWDKLLTVVRQKKQKTKHRLCIENILCFLHKVYGLWQFDWHWHISCTGPAIAPHQ